MSPSNFNIKGISSEVMKLLEKEAKRQGTSVNNLILKMLDEGLGFSSKKRRFHDLDHLAGTWSALDEKIFKKNTKQFERMEF